MTESLSLDFEAERDEQTTNFERADPTAAITADYGVFIGRCTCDGFDFHEKPCAHLGTIRKAYSWPSKWRPSETMPRPRYFGQGQRSHSLH